MVVTSTRWWKAIEVGLETGRSGVVSEPAGLVWILNPWLAE